MNLFLQHPKKWIVLVTMSTLVLLLPLSELVPDNSLNVWFSQDEEAMQNYTRFKQTFGNDANITIVYKNERLFSESQLDLNRTITTKLNDLKNVSEVISLTNINTIQLNGLDFVSDVLIPTYRKDFNKIKQEVLANPVLVGNLISGDGTVTTLVLKLEKDDDESSKQTVKEVKKILADPGFSENEFHVFGGLAILAEMNELSNRESGLFVSLMIVVALLLLMWLFKSFRFGLFPVVIAIVSALWATALYATHHTLNMMTAIMPLIILVISIADSVHIIFDYREFRFSGIEKREAIKAAIDRLFLPCLFTSITTAIAFLSFNFSNVPPLRSLGQFTGLGVLIAFVLSFTLLPVLLVRFDKNDFQNSKNKTGFILKNKERWIRAIYQSVSAKRRLILLICTALVGIAVYGISQLRFETDQIQYFKSSHPVRAAQVLARDSFNGIYPLEIVIDAQKEGYFYKTEHLEKIQQLELKILQEEPVKRIISIFSYHSRLKQIQEENQLPDISNSLMDRILQKFVNSYPQFVSPFISPDGSQIRISVRTRWLDDEHLKNLMGRIREILNERTSADHLQYYLTGHVLMYSALNDKLERSQLTSFLICFAAIFLMLVFLVRSIHLGVLGMIPNLLPLVLTLGIIGWLGIKLDVATVMIAALSLGIAVDDSVHLLHAYVVQQKFGESTENAIKKAMIQTAGPITITTLILVTGFSVMVFSSFLPIVYFGVFFSLNIFFAIIGDLVILPAMLSIGKKNR